MDIPPQAKVLVKAGLESRILLRDNPKYAACTASYFDNASKLQPACFLQPCTALEAARAIQVLANAGQRFAVRSGGCTVRPGSNNINDGVTIDLSLLNSVEYNDDETAHIGTGATWDQVYDELEKHDRVAAGGRVAGVGVGGYLLGGGFSFHTGRHGLGCDNVVSYQLALADGRLITVSAREHEDLFHALKGGGNNFGIVTRFTVKTFPNSKIWGGLSFKAVDVLPAAAEALVEFTTHASEDEDSTMLLLAANMPKHGGTGVVMLTYNAGGVEKPRAFDKCMSIPEIFSQYQTTRIQEFLPFDQLPWPRDMLNVWYTLTFKNDAGLIMRASEQLYKFGEELQTQTSDFTTHVAFQPIPRLYAEKAAATGGNVLGLEKIPYDAIMLQASVSVKTVEVADWVRPRFKAFVDDLRAFIASRDGLVPWTYLNYAHASQDVFQGYGEENVNAMREVAVRYDPQGIFQSLCIGGHKISASGT
ncbi:hypothetical protein N0V93_007927 [Gnomoniopsis smithogilvyi]|uniref:FAD-binding PCMH-type domain-containing protein n=1 Tax=Gnomoniopsis smithogilvyi TaxID=1191159 RepID=A0A9W8YN75_9PEZI|nr:hypothetical protein N0V93_007927 [Gnomoniopsis smithogilvyi]